MGVLAQDQIAREALTIDFGDFQSKAELTFPANGKGPFPTVILIPGSGPEDMNASVYAYSEASLQHPVLLSHIFRDIAEYLSARGVAVLRYNKHYVSGSFADYYIYASGGAGWLGTLPRTLAGLLLSGAAFAATFALGDARPDTASMLLLIVVIGLANYALFRFDDAHRKLQLAQAEMARLALFQQRERIARACTTCLGTRSA